MISSSRQYNAYFLLFSFCFLKFTMYFTPFERSDKIESVH